MAEIIRYAQGDSSLGKFVAALSARGLAMLEFSDVGAPLDGLRARFPEADLVEDRESMRDALALLSRLVEQPHAKADLPLDLQGSTFELRVWAALREIPAGETVSYGELAARIGSPRQAKEVAEACAANTLAVVVPCHRVVRKDGGLAGYRWGYRRKRALIERERSEAAAPSS